MCTFGVLTRPSASSLARVAVLCTRCVNNRSVLTYYSTVVYCPPKSACDCGLAVCSTMQNLSSCCCCTYCDHCNPERSLAEVSVPCALSVVLLPYSLRRRWLCDCVNLPHETLLPDALLLLLLRFYHTMPAVLNILHRSHPS